MYPLLETIRIEDRQIINIHYHQERVNKSLQMIGAQSRHLELEEHIIVPDEYASGLVKCRILYGAGEMNFDFKVYIKRKIEYLHLRDGSALHYSIKWANRDPINKLMFGLDSNKDILIIRDQRVTDTSYCNVAFLKDDTWYTPEKPLLEGTQRQYLIDKGKIVPAEILVSDLDQYSAIRLFNAMINWEEAIELNHWNENSGLWSHVQL